MNQVKALVDEQKDEQTEMLELGQKYQSDLRSFTDFSIEDDDDHVMVGTWLVELATARKEIDGRRKKVTAPLNEAIKAFGAWYKPALTAIESIEKHLRAEVGKYTLKKRLESEEASRLTAEAAKAGDFDLAHEASKGIQQAPDLSKITVTDRWDFEVTDPSLVPREWLLVNVSAIGEHAKAAKKDEPAPIPGVRFFRAASLIVRTK